MKKLLIICGSTATGKTNLALKLSKIFSGQIISADSRQVYKGMDIGTGKDLPQKAKQYKDGHYLIKKIKVWGYDLVKPNQDFSVAHFINFAIPRIKKIWTARELPILVGGTGLTKPLNTIAIPANQVLRQQLSKLNVLSLQKKLKKLDFDKYQKMNHSDQHNPRRLIRAIEINLKGPTLKVKKTKRLNLAESDQFWVGLTANKKNLDNRVEKRVLDRISANSKAEVESLIKAGYSWNLPSMSAMGYKQWQPYFKKNINIDKVIKSWTTAEKQYLRRQITWFHKKPYIKWFNINSHNYPQIVVTQLKSWYTK